MISGARLVPLGLLLLLPVPATTSSQYLYLDANGDGVCDVSDQLAPEGPTNVDVWLVTDRNRDGTPVTCNVGPPAQLTVNAYAFILHADGGSVRWGPMHNRLPFTAEFPTCFASGADTTGGDYYHNGWGWIDPFPPGRHRLATLVVEVLSGTPALVVESVHPGSPGRITGFGTQCLGPEWDHTFKLGFEWHDADGIGPTLADAGGPYAGRAGSPIVFRASQTGRLGGPSPVFHWTFGDGSTGTGTQVQHAYQAAGEYVVVLTVTRGDEIRADTTYARVVESQAPIANAGGPYTGYVGVPLRFDGRRSSDADGEALTFRWEFGDGLFGEGATPAHTYSAAGAHDVRLTVFDGRLSDTDVTSAAIHPNPHPPVAVAGGPYVGYVGRVIHFSGEQSSDPDGDGLHFLWDFGDGSAGVGMRTGHAYSSPGEFVVRLSVSDGFLGASDVSRARVAAAFPARAFGDGSPPTVALDSPEPFTLYLEPSRGAFQAEEIDPMSPTLQPVGAGIEIAPIEEAFVGPDTDGNGVPEMVVRFSPTELRSLVGEGDPPWTVPVTAEGWLLGGGFFTADLTLRIVPSASGIFAHVPEGLRISPNPFNPVAHVTFWTSTTGPVEALLFDIHGRKVRTVLSRRMMDAGPHAITLDARGEEGTELSSGVYFLRLESRDGVAMKRIAVAK